MSLKIAAIQVTSGEDAAANVAATSALIREAAAGGAKLIATPENTGLMAKRREDRLAQIRPEAEDPALAAFSALAAELNIALLIGSLGILRADGARVNRSYLIAPDGGILARYDKIHLFDADLPGGERYRESHTFAAGDKAVTARLPWGKIGLSICYDLRFAELYRALALQGADLIAIPAAFTRTTGKAHWHVLVRARAIETGAFVLAPAQCGTHPGGRETFGHSLIVSPWGEILAEGGDTPAIVAAELDLRVVADARRQIPTLTSARAFA